MIRNYRQVVYLPAQAEEALPGYAAPSRAILHEGCRQYASMPAARSNARSDSGMSRLSVDATCDKMIDAHCQGYSSLNLLGFMPSLVTLFLSASAAVIGGCDRV
jgi:hypothetical protein